MNDGERKDVFKKTLASLILLCSLFEKERERVKSDLHETNPAESQRESRFVFTQRAAFSSSPLASSSCENQMMDDE